MVTDSSLAPDPIQSGVGLKLKSALRKNAEPVIYRMKKPEFLAPQLTERALGAQGTVGYL